MIPTLAVVLVTLFTLGVGTLGLRFARTTSNFFVASRAVNPVWNAFAVGGEYLSAGTQLGLAGLVLVFGADMLWFPAGYTAGYLLLLLFVAAPLRRFGSFTIPEFAEGRLGSTGLRRIAAGFVLVIGWLYLLPQMKGAGITVRAITGAPYWVGVVLVGLVIALNLTAGGMRGITYVQAFQYVIMVTAMAVPAIILFIAWMGDDTRSLTQPEPPRFAEATEVEFRRDTTFVVDEPIGVTIVEGSLTDATGDALGPTAPEGSPTVLDAGPHTAAEGTVVTFAADGLVPHREGITATDGFRWAAPLTGGPGGGHPLYFVYSVMFATFLGTMGLPHVLVRFYTNATGSDARRTTVIVVGLLGMFYVWPPLLGALGRLYTPELLVTGETDSTVLALPEAILGGWGGEWVTGAVAAGAVAAFLSTSSGLMISVASAISHDLVGGGVRQFRFAVWGAAAVAVVLGLGAEPFQINVLVGWAFAIAASSFCPLLVLGIWWSGLSKRGAAAGMLAGGGSATIAIAATMVGLVEGGWAGALASAPAAWSVPLAFSVAIVVSRLDADPPARARQHLAILHLPDPGAVDHSPSA